MRRLEYRFGRTYRRSSGFVCESFESGILANSHQSHRIWQGTWNKVPSSPNLMLHFVVVTVLSTQRESVILRNFLSTHRLWPARYAAGLQWSSLLSNYIDRFGQTLFVHSDYTETVCWRESLMDQAAIGQKMFNRSSVVREPCILGECYTLRHTLCKLARSKFIAGLGDGRVLHAGALEPCPTLSLSLSLSLYENGTHQILKDSNKRESKLFARHCSGRLTLVPTKQNQRKPNRVRESTVARKHDSWERSKNRNSPLVGNHFPAIESVCWDLAQTTPQDAIAERAKNTQSSTITCRKHEHFHGPIKWLALWI